MSPSCSKAALRVLVSVLLASSVANAVALPHPVLDARSPELQIGGAQLADAALQVAAAVSSDVPENVFEEISDDLNSKSGYQWMMDFFARLFGAREDTDDDDDADSTSTTTVYVTSTPTPAESLASAVSTTTTPLFGEVSSVVSPPGPPSVTSIPSSTTSIPSDDMMSILPVGDMSSAINATFLTPIFVTASEATPVLSSSSLPVVPPFPANSTTSAGLLPTAASITDRFSVYTPLPAASSVSAGLPLPWGGNWTYPAINPTLILTNPIQPTPSAESDATAAVNTTSTTVSLTSVTVIVETIIPTPILVTGTAPAVSAGTGSPIAVSESPLWANTTTCTSTTTTEIAVILPGTGTGAPISVGTAVPIASFSESPLYPNTTTPSMTPSASEAPVFVTQVPLTVTGAPGSVLNVSVSIPGAPYPNSTVSSTPMIMSTGAPVALPSPLSSSEPSYFNTTTTVGIPLEPITAPISAGTIAPVLSFSETPLYPNTTTAIVTDIVVSTATAILILPTPSDVAVEFPGKLNVTVVLPTGGYRRRGY